MVDILVVILEPLLSFYFNEKQIAFLELVREDGKVFRLVESCNNTEDSFDKMLSQESLSFHGIQVML